MRFPGVAPGMPVAPLALMKKGGRREHQEKQSMLREAELGEGVEDLGRVGEEDLSDPTEEIVIENK